MRGFEMWTVTPFAYIPSSATVNVYNSDGTQRTQRQIVNGISQQVPVTMQIPSYQLIQPGGDFQSIANFEYRIPIMGPVTLAAFFDAGMNRILMPGQLTMVPSQVENLNNAFPQAGFSGKVKIVPGTQKIRASTGLELQVMLPIVQAPFRLYWAYNPSVVRQYMIPPIVADRASFPNNATFIQALMGFGQAIPWFEKRTMFRFTIGRTF